MCVESDENEMNRNKQKIHDMIWTEILFNFVLFQFSLVLFCHFVRSLSFSKFSNRLHFYPLLLDANYWEYRHFFLQLRHLF